MEIAEKKDLLTNNDIEIINGFVEKPNIRLLIFTILFTGVAGFASWLLNTLFPVIALAVLSLIVIFWYLLMLRKIKKYTGDGTKIVIEGKLEGKFEKTLVQKQTKNFSASANVFNFFIIGGKDYMIPWKYYPLFNPGDDIELHITIFDNIVFKVEKGWKNTIVI